MSGLFDIPISSTDANNLYRSVGYLLALGTEDGADVGNVKSHSPHVKGQFDFTVSKALQRHHVFLLFAHEHDVV